MQFGIGGGLGPFYLYQNLFRVGPRQLLQPDRRRRGAQAWGLCDIAHRSPQTAARCRDCIDINAENVARAEAQARVRATPMPRTLAAILGWTLMISLAVLAVLILGTLGWVLVGIGVVILVILGVREFRRQPKGTRMSATLPPVTYEGFTLTAALQLAWGTTFTLKPVPQKWLNQLREKKRA